jgi:hypothetical protein
MLNPFLDETGQSDVLLKAQAFNMKVWDFKSECPTIGFPDVRR